VRVAYKRCSFADLMVCYKMEKVFCEIPFLYEKELIVTSGGYHL